MSKRRRKSKVHRTPRTRAIKPKVVYVIVPKTQMKAKNPAMLADPNKAVITQIASDLDHARTFKTRTGAWQHVNGHKELRRGFWYRRIEVPAKKAA